MPCLNENHINDHAISSIAWVSEIKNTSASILASIPAFIPLPSPPLPLTQPKYGAAAW